MRQTPQDFEYSSISVQKRVRILEDANTFLPPEQEEITEKHILGQHTILEKNVEIGEGTKIWNFCHIMEGAKIGKNCKIGSYVHIDRDVVIGDNVNIQNYVCLYRGVIVEDNVFIGPGVMTTNVLKPDPEHVVPTSAYRNTYIREGSAIGARVIIVCGADIQGKIAAGCTVLSNQVIRQDLNDKKWIHGYPIKQYST